MFFNRLLNGAVKSYLTLQQRSISLNGVLRQGSHYSPNAFERRCLVWTGKYKSLDEVPNLVSGEVMERCRNRVRIRIANIMMALTAVGCVYMVYSGKEAAKRGETVAKQNIDWHTAYNKQESK